MVDDSIVQIQVALQLPSGPTSYRPISPLPGMTRFNTDLNEQETWNGSTWITAIGINQLQDDTSPTLGGSLDANSNVINNLANPTADDQAATKAYVDSAVEMAPVSSVNGEDGSVLIGFSNLVDYDANNNSINNLADPTTDNQAATKNYVDSEIANINFNGTQVEAQRTATNYIGLISDSITDHLSGVDTELGNQSATIIDNSDRLNDLESGIVPRANNLNMGGNTINNLADPTTDDQVATKAYVDFSIATDLVNSVAVSSDNDLIITDTPSGDVTFSTPRAKISDNTTNNPAQITVGATGAIALGPGTVAASQAIGIGDSATATFSNTIVIGKSSFVTGTGGIVIGGDSSSNGTDSIAIGNNTNSNGSSSVAIGPSINNCPIGGTKIQNSSSSIEQESTGELSLSGADAQFVLPEYTVSTLPTGQIGGMIFVSDESGGSVPAFFDGSDWRRVTDRAIVS